MEIETTALDGVLILTPTRHGDDRGWFSETWNRQRLLDAGVDVDFVQDNHSRSGPVGTLRGLHFQRAPHAQTKLVRVVRGAVLDVAVDLRPDSPTFTDHVAIELTAENGRQLLVPKGFGHGFVTREPDTEVCYKVDAYYAPDADAGVAWNDPDLGIDWGVSETDVVLSDKDRALPALEDVVFEW